MKAFLAVVLSAASIGIAAAQPSAKPKTLPETQRCMVAEQLKAVYTHPSLFKDRDRFVIVSVTGRPQAYVQCLFANSEKLLYCEASSLYYAEPDDKPRTLHLPPDRIKALARLGFATGPNEKNFRYERPIDSTADFDAIAAFMLTALREGHGLRKGEQIQMKTLLERNASASCR
jgi:hypothetical protein